MRALFLESLPLRSAFKVGSHHYAERFAAAGWDALWLSQPISALHYLHPVKRDWEERVEGWRHGPVDRDGISYYSPFTLLPTASQPLLRSGFVARHSALATVPPTTGVVSRAGFDRPDVAWLTNPVYQPLAAKVRPRCTAMRIADDTTQFRNVPASVAQLERSSLEMADVVFAVARRVHDRLADRHSNVVLLPNGADTVHFSAPRPEPADLAALPHPRVLYVGSMEYWFDAQLVADAARALPHASFVIVGPPAEGQRVLESIPNVHLLGARPYAEVPAYVQHCDVGIIPFIRDEMVDAVHPIKVYEYLAAGLRVVGIRWPELEAMGSPSVLTDRAEWVEALRDTLATPDTPAAREERLRYAARNSWDARFEVVSAEVARLLGGAS